MKESITQYRYDPSKTVMVWDTTHLEKIAEIAFDLIKTNGFICGTSDGEDSSGRAKMKLLPPEEVVTRAFSISENFMELCHKRGYIFNAPSLSSIESS